MKMKNKSKILFFLSFFLLLFLIIPGSLGADTSYTSGSSATNVDRGNTDISNPTNALSDNEVYATCDIPSKGSSDYLYVYNFGFDLPSGATIDGIIVQIEDYGESTNILEENLYLYFDGSIQGDNKMGSSQIGEFPDADTYQNYGAIDDTWNSGITETDLESSAFGIYVSYYSDHNTQPREVFIDHVQIIAYYTLPAEENEPTWDTLSESSDPLELGNTETIEINVYDESTIANVYLEFDNVNHSMSLKSGDTYEYTTWTPTTTGIKTYEIHMIDEHGNTATTGDQTITVQDTTNPTISNVVESADPLILGNVETIECDVTDANIIEWVYLEFEGSNHSMSVKSGDTYEYTTWQPASSGLYDYTIWANDSAGNLAHVDGSIQVNDPSGDVLAPDYKNLVIEYNPCELENFVKFTIEINDTNDILFVYLEFNGINYSMNSLGDDVYYFAILPNFTGEYEYVIWFSDTNNNIDSITGILIVQDSQFIVLSIIAMIFLMGLIFIAFIKLKIYIVILVVYIFSLMIGMSSLEHAEIPFFPNFSVFFMLFQSSIFLYASIQKFTGKMN